MQRAKHADRKQRTRMKILIGDAAMRAGASHLPVEEIEAVLAEQGQCLHFEPPHFGDASTIGGTLACNLSGPARPWAIGQRKLSCLCFGFLGVHHDSMHVGVIMHARHIFGTWE